jgi:cathepsin F
MKSLILVALLSLAVFTQVQGNFDQLAAELFSQFQETYGIQYSSQAETEYRFKIFESNLVTIAELQKAESSATFGITKFSDLTPEEFAATYLGYNPALKSAESQPDYLFVPANVEDIPDSIDWRTLGAVTDVKDQGQCGSCWAFSATANIEGQWFLKNGELVSFAEQQFVDCDKIDEGCDGGLMTNAFDYLEGVKGLETLKEYPYEGVDEKCKFNKSDSGLANVTGYFNVSTNETEIAAALVATGPLAIAVDATIWQFYFGGILGEWTEGYLCGTSLDHGVTLVGYGTSGSTPYWIIKNSWGADWGESGYIRVIRGYGACGLNLDVSSSIVG